MNARTEGIQGLVFFLLVLLTVAFAMGGAFRQRSWALLVSAWLTFAVAAVPPHGSHTLVFLMAAACFAFGRRAVDQLRRAGRISLGALATLAFLLLATSVTGGPYCESCDLWPFEPWRSWVIVALPVLLIELAILVPLPGRRGMMPNNVQAS